MTKLTFAFLAWAYNKEMKTIFILFWFLTTSAFACTCAESWNARELYNNSDAIFLGIPESKTVRLSSRRGYTRFRVLTNIKKTPVSRRNVYHDLDSDACGLQFAKDEGVLLVALDKTGTRYYSTGCDTWIVSENWTQLTRFVRELTNLPSRNISSQNSLSLP